MSGEGNQIRRTLKLGDDRKQVFGTEVSRTKTDKRVRRQKKEGHDEVIAQLAGKNTLVHIVFIDQEDIETYPLKESDRFTITVWTDEQRRPQDQEIIYKHAIRSLCFTVNP